MVRILIGLFLYSSLIINSLYAQIEFTELLPKDKAFLSQDRINGAATLRFKGKVTDFSYTYLQVEVFRDGVSYRSYRPYLNHLGLYRYFDLGIQLPAGKHFYKIKYNLIGKIIYTQEVDSILVGDVYLIQGQSNAVAHSYTPFDTSYYSPYLRSFGSSSPNPNLSVNDSSWYDLDASKSYNKGSVGQWAAVMASNLLDSFGVPICLLNGAHGGRPINFFTPYALDHFNTGTNYGRLLTRVKNANLQSSIRGIFFFQGESDGANAVKHDTTFREIVKAWKKDYQNLQKLYVIQVRSGCGGPSIQLREVQRQFGLTIDKCQTVSANGLNAHDGCHYAFKNGYELLGQQLARLVGRDFYDSQEQNVDPPDVKSAVYNNANQTEVKLLMQRPLDSVYADVNFHTLFGINGDSRVWITDGKIVNNTVILTLNTSSCLPLTLSYDGYRGNNPWVKNSTEMGLISFNNLPIISHAIVDQYFACKNEKVILEADSISGCTYLWQNMTDNSKYAGARWALKMDSSQIFQVVVYYDSTICKLSDTVIVNVNVDLISLPIFKDEYTLCEGNSVILNKDRSSFEKFEWNGQESWSYLLDTTEKINWSGLSTNKCFYQDSFKSILIASNLNIADSIFICEGTDTLIRLNKSYQNYWWNGVKGSDSFLSATGSVRIMVETNQGCYDSSIIHVVPHEQSFHPIWNFIECPMDTINVIKPEEIESWFINENQISDTITLTNDSSFMVSWSDYLGCHYSDLVSRVSHIGPIINIPNDTGFCVNSDVFIDIGNKNYSYNWLKPDTNTSKLLIDTPGIYTVSVIDSNNCSISFSFTIDSWDVELLNQFKDTSICIDSSWTIPLDSSITYWFNNIEINDKITLYPGISYAIEAHTEQGCMTEKDIKIGIRDCVLNTEDYTFKSIDIYPNPVQDKILIRSSIKIDSFRIFNTLGELILYGNLTIPGIQVKSLNSGSYFVELEETGTNKSYYRKFIK